jgi:hypothetical protein
MVKEMRKAGRRPQVSDIGAKMMGPKTAGEAKHQAVLATAQGIWSGAMGRLRTIADEEHGNGKWLLKL